MLLQPNQLQDYLTHSAQSFPDKIALIFDCEKLTYRMLDELTNRMAHYLEKQGLQRGDRVIVCMGNCIETVITFWSVLKAGGIISIINDDLTPEKIHYIAKDSGCRFLVTTAEIAKKVFSGNDIQLYEIKNVIIKDYSRVDGQGQGFYLDYKEAISSDVSLKLPAKNLDIDLASIIYTSGSTGEPKGVMLTHRNMLAATHSINTYLGNRCEDVILSVLPLSFDYGLYQMIMAFSVGACLVLEKDLILPLRFLKKINEYKVTALPGVPTLFAILGEFGQRYKSDTSSVRYVTNTGAAVYDHHITIIQKLFRNAQFYSMYGLTECKRCTYLPPHDLKRKPGSVGVAIPNTEIWIIDDTGKRLPPNQLGQLVIRGATVMKGYWNRPDETAEKLSDGLLPTEKVLLTGDYGMIDEEGYFYFKGRMDEAVKSRGVKISPKAIEEMLNTIPGIKEAAIICLPDTVLGYKIIACVACYPDAMIDETTINKLCRQQLDKSHLPHRIIVQPGLPKSANGKIDKRKLVDALTQEATLLEAAND